MSSSDNTAAQHRLSKLDSASKFSEELGKLTGDKVPAASSKDEKAAEEKSSDEEEENKKEWWETIECGLYESIYSQL